MPPPSRPCWNASASILPTTAPWLETFETEVAQFPQSKYADQVDSMVHFLTALLSRNRVTRDLTAFEDWPHNAF